MYLGHTALIGGYQILDASLVPIPGATLSSQSGYDYLTPPSAAAPDAPAVPEPGSLYLTAAVLAMLVKVRGLARKQGS